MLKMLGRGWARYKDYLFSRSEISVSSCFRSKHEQLLSHNITRVGAVQFEKNRFHAYRVWDVSQEFSFLLIDWQSRTYYQYKPRLLSDVVYKKCNRLYLSYGEIRKNGVVFESIKDRDQAHFLFGLYPLSNNAGPDETLLFPCVEEMYKPETSDPYFNMCVYAELFSTKSFAVYRNLFMDDGFLDLRASREHYLQWKKFNTNERSLDALELHP